MFSKEILNFIKAKEEIYSIINKALNEYGVQCCILEPVIKDILNQIQEGTDTEITNATRELQEKSELNSEERKETEQDDK